MVSVLAAFCMLPWIAFLFAPLVNGLSGLRANEDEEARFGVAGDNLRAFPRYETAYRLSGVGRSPQDLYRPSFVGQTPILRSPIGRITSINRSSHNSPVDNRTKSSSS